ncbi:MAG: hypothetical protein ABII01_04675 [Candidatus Woesearchaeota archaeon]
MKSLIFDTGSIISMALNNLLWILDPLKKRFKGKFFVTEEAKIELIETPLKIRRFEFEALQTLTYFKKNTLEVIANPEIDKLQDYLLDLANKSYKSKGKYITIVQRADMEGIAAAIFLNSEAFVVDERTSRWLIEKPTQLRDHLSSRLHRDIEIDKTNLLNFQKEVKNVKFLRSTELGYAAYKLGLLDEYIPDLPNPKKMLLESILWGLKLRGCAISKKEIFEIVRSET